MTWSFPKQNKPRRLFPVLMVSAMVVVTSCTEDPTSSAESQLRPVRFLQIEPGGKSQRRIFTGQAQSVVRSMLSFKVAGTVNTLPVKVGDSVAPDQIIATLTARDYEIRVQEAEAALDRARAELRNATANYERVRSLYETNTASKGELDQARTGFELARAQLQAIAKQLEATRLQLTYTQLRSPGDCLVASTLVTRNENVAVAAPVVEVTCGEDYEVTIAVPELLIVGIKEGDTAIVGFDALPGRQFTALVSEVGVASTDASTTFPVTVLLNEADPDIRSGMAAEVVFEFRATDGDRLLLPAVAVGEDRDGRFVYLLEPGAPEQGVVRRRTVTVGNLTASGLEVLTGVSPGDRVITAGVSRLQDGMAVRLPGNGDS